MTRHAFLAISLCSALAMAGSAWGASDNQCSGKLVGSPLKGSLRVISAFQSGVHLGVDYKTDGESVTAVNDGAVAAVKWDLRTLPSSNTRTGLAIQGWGRYVIIHHSDGSESLYAHLDKDSTKSLKVGAPVTKGQVIGTADSTGAVTGSHLHFEYSPSGSIYVRSNKKNGDPCVGRTGIATLYSLMKLQGGSFKLFLDDASLGQVEIGEKKELALPPMAPYAVHRLKLETVRAQMGGVANYALDLSEPFEFLNAQEEITGRGEYGELKEGASLEFKFLAQ